MSDIGKKKTGTYVGSFPMKWDPIKLMMLKLL